MMEFQQLIHHQLVRWTLWLRTNSKHFVRKWLIVNSTTKNIRKILFILKRKLKQSSEYCLRLMAKQTNESSVLFQTAGWLAKWRSCQWNRQHSQAISLMTIHPMSTGLLAVCCSHFETQENWSLPNRSTNQKRM